MAKKNFSGGLGDILGKNSGSLELTILPELQAFIPPLTEEERNLLKESIGKDGVKEPLDIWLKDDKAIIIDGHNRYVIATELNTKYATKEHEFANIQEVKDWMLKKQLGRRNLSDLNRTYLIGLLYQKAKGEKGKYDRDSMNDTSSKKSTADQIAQQTGSSVRTVKNAGNFAEGIDKLSDDMKAHVLSGKEKVSKAVVQELAGANPDKPIESPEELKKEVLKVQEAKKRKKSGVKKDDDIFEPIENFKKTSLKEEEKASYTTPNIDAANDTSEVHGKAVNKSNNEELNDIELYAETKDKFIEHFGNLDDEILISVLNDMLALRGSMSDNVKLANDGYTILRTADTPSIHIKHFSTEKNSWKSLENNFSSKAKRDKRFRELLNDAKTIQG